MQNLTHVEGANVGSVVLYALSTCIWCKKTKALLDELKIAYSFAFVDLLESEENSIARKELEQWNPRCSFPTLVINNEACIVGFDDEKIRGLLK